MDARTHIFLSHKKWDFQTCGSSVIQNVGSGSFVAVEDLQGSSF